VSPLVEPQPGNRFVSFVRASGRGEAKPCGRARGDKIVVRWLLREFFHSSAGISVPALVFRGKVYKTNVKVTFCADNLIKPIQKQYVSRTAL